MMDSILANRSLPRRRILVVDDTRASSYILGTLLKKMGQDVRIANDAAAGLQSAENDRPDLVFSDIGMPKMDGYQFARRLRQDPRLRETVLVALTGYGQEADKQRAREAGFDCHLVKPASLEDLQVLLANLPSISPVGRIS